MKRNKLGTHKVGGTLPTAAATGMVVSALLSGLLIILSASLILNDHLSDNSIAGCAFVIRAIAAFAGSMVAATILRGNYLKAVGLAVGGYLLMLSFIGIVFYDEGLKSIAIGVLSALIGGVAALAIVLNPRGAGRKRVKINI